MTDTYNLTGLALSFQECCDRDEKTLAFELSDGKGRFLFLMFFDDDDTSTLDRLYIFMKNTKKMFKTKLYGNHKNGDFYIYLNDAQKAFFRRELKITSLPNSIPFEFDAFFSRLNANIPSAIALRDKITTIREAWSEINGDLPREVIDDCEKTKFDRFIKLPKEKNPREQTLRKLYLFWNARPNEIEQLVADLKRNNKTAAWTTP